MSALAAQDGVRVIAEGRPAAPITEGNGDRFYERRRIKRTVPIDATISPSVRWDKLADGPEGSVLKASYCDWDDDFLYLAVELSEFTDVRFDIDGKGDGWFRGADNLSLRLQPDPTSASGVRLRAERFDTLQNRDRPVWAASPIPTDAFRVAMARTSSGGICALIAIPNTELIGLKRKQDSEFGLRIDAGEGVAAPSASEIGAGRPMLRLSLANDVSATTAGLTAKFRVRSRQLVPGEPLRGTLEIKNTTEKQLPLKRVFFGGSLSGQSIVTGSDQAEIYLTPGETLRRDFTLPVADSIGMAAFVLQGGAEREDGQRVVALTAVDRVEPFTVELDLDDKPIVTSDGDGDERRRLAVVTVRSRSDGKKSGKVTLTLPDGWTAEGELTRTLSLSFASEVKGASFKINVPRKAPVGNYTIGARVEFAGRVYTKSTALRVIEP